MQDDRPVPADDDPLTAVARVIAAFGVGGRAVRELVARLTERAHPFAALIRDSGLSRRTVEQVLDALGADLVRRSGGGEPELMIAPERRAAYRELCRYDHLVRTRPADPLGERMAAASELIEGMAALVAAAPVPRRALDHVAATPETAVRRAVWLDATYELAGRRLLCVGDHDLTSLAVCQVSPGVAVTVVDIDERILEFIDGQAARLGLDIRCLYADLRFGLPAGAAGQADLVVTDPPYTPEGVRLFLARGLAGLRDRENARLVMAYGFGERHPALGLKVQRAAQELHLACEAMLPDFNRYVGAQAVGSSSDMYVFRPTAKTWPLIEERPAARTKINNHGIYTHGPQSLEAVTEPPPAEVTDALLGAAAIPGMPDAPTTLAEVGTLITGGRPRDAAARAGTAVAADLAQDPGPWLLRTLLAVNATRLALLVPNNHPDLSDAEGQRRLTALVGPKYTLRFRRSTPTSRHAIVEATAVRPAAADPAALVAHTLLSRVHGKLGNVWREALVQAARTARGVTLTKNQARAAIEKAVPDAGLLDLRLIELPRHQIGELLSAPLPDL